MAEVLAGGGHHLNIKAALAPEENYSWGSAKSCVNATVEATNIRKFHFVTVSVVCSPGGYLYLLE